MKYVNVPPAPDNCIALHKCETLAVKTEAHESPGPLLCDEIHSLKAQPQCQMDQTGQ